MSLPRPDEDRVDGVNCEVYPDFATGKVVSRFLHPETGEIITELHLDPETAREYALQSTRASIAIEEHRE